MKNLINGISVIKINLEVFYSGPIYEFEVMFYKQTVVK